MIVFFFRSIHKHYTRVEQALEVPLDYRSRRHRHTVIVLDDGFEYAGKRWKTLTAVARAITGTHWNGPLFFGLTQRKQKS